MSGKKEGGKGEGKRERADFLNIWLEKPIVKCIVLVIIRTYICMRCISELKLIRNMSESWVVPK